MNRIFVTGANGFIGSRLVEKLILMDNPVSALVRTSCDYANNNLSIFEGDILNTNTILDTMKGCDTLFHCAAYISFQKKDFCKAYDINVLGTRNVLEAAYRANIKKVVHLSACAVLGYSDKDDTIINENANQIISKDNVYAYTKKLAEEEALNYAAKGLDVSIANIATVYGPGDLKLNSGTIIKSIFEGKMLFVPPGGTSFVGIDDLIEGLILLSKHGRLGERYIFCTENMSYDILVSRIASVLGVTGPKLKLPRLSYYPAILAGKVFELFSGSNDSKVNLITSRIVKETFGYKYYNPRKAIEELGWKPIQTLEEAVAKAFLYYRDKGLM